MFNMNEWMKGSAKGNNTGALHSWRLNGYTRMYRAFTRIGLLATFDSPTLQDTLSQHFMPIIECLETSACTIILVFINFSIYAIESFPIRFRGACQWLEIGLKCCYLSVTFHKAMHLVSKSVMNTNYIKPQKLLYLRNELYSTKITSTSAWNSKLVFGIQHHIGRMSSVGLLAFRNHEVVVMQELNLFFCSIRLLCKVATEHSSNIVGDVHSRYI